MSLWFHSLSRWRERVGVRVTQCQRNRLQYRCKLGQHLMVPESQDLPPLAIDELRAASVICRGLPLHMLTTIQLHHQLAFHAGKVCDVGADGVLAAKFMAVQLARTQVTP